MIKSIILEPIMIHSKKERSTPEISTKTGNSEKQEFADADGTKYYYNAKTGLSQWERPREWDQMERNERERVEREERRTEREEKRQRQEKVAPAAREDEMKKPPMPGIEGWEVSKTLEVFFLKISTKIYTHTHTHQPVILQVGGGFHFC